VNASKNPPGILVIGAGRFGREHIREWQALQALGRARLAGAVVATRASSEKISKAFGIEVHVGFEPSLLKDIDGVDIVTPMDTHFDLVRKCIEHVHVLVEKPLAVTLHDARHLAALAERNAKRIMVGCVFRFHPVSICLRELLSDLPGKPLMIRGVFLNEIGTSASERSPHLEMLHYFDLLDWLFDARPTVVHAVARCRHVRSSLQCGEDLRAVFDLGWSTGPRERLLTVIGRDYVVTCDYLQSLVTINRSNSMVKVSLAMEPIALRNELDTFVDVISDRAVSHPDAAAGVRVLDFALRSTPMKWSDRPRVAVLGGGIFGITTALELSESCDVTLFERHDSLLTEASYLNQWRHHSGFHYMRSAQTILEIRESREDFNSVYKCVVRTDVPSFYATASGAREITSERFLSVSRAFGLNFRIADPPPEMLSLDQVSLCVLTDESVIDFEQMKALMFARLKAASNLRVRLASPVIAGSLCSDGSKRLVVRSGSDDEEHEFDYVVNATYANQNLLAGWFALPIRPLRFDFTEMCVLEIDAPMAAITVLDGPFTSLLPTGSDNQFLLSSIHDSLLGSVGTADGLPPGHWRRWSNHRRIIDHARRFFPVLDGARYVDSRFSLRAVDAQGEDYDGRPTVITDHGFGCWSVLGGKIITCVTNAREIRRAIERETGGDSIGAG